MNNQNWQATNYQKDRLISDTKKYIKQKLDELQRHIKNLENEIQKENKIVE